MAQPLPSPESPPARVDHRHFALVGLVLGITQLSFYLTAAALPLYLRDTGAAQDRIGLEANVSSLVALALVLVTGPAINRYGSKALLRLSAAIVVVTSAGMLAFASEGAITAFRALQGVGAALTLPSAYTLGTVLMAGRQATALSMLGALSNVALAIGPPLGLTLYAGYGAAGLFLPAIAAAALGVASTTLMPSHEGQRRPSGLGFDRRWIPPLFATTFFMLYWGGIVAYLPLVLREAHGPNAGIFFTADALGVLAFRVPIGMLIDRRGSLVPKLLGLLITIPGIIVLVFHPSIAILIIGGACTGVGAAFFLTGVMTDLAWMSTPDNRGTAMSLSGGTFSAGVFVGGAVSGLLIGPAGFNAILYFGVAACLAAFPFALGRRGSSSVRQ